MRKFVSALFDRFRQGIIGGLVGLGLGSLLVGPVAMALVIPQQFAPRYFQTQQTHYIRVSLNFNSCVIAPAATTCSVKIGAIPYNAFLTTIHKQILTTFNPTTSATWGLGVASGSAGVMAAFNVFTGASTAAVTDTAFTGAGELVTGNTIASTGADGGFDLWATYTTGAAGSQGTQGQVIFVIEYIAPNDGSCAPVPIGSSAAGC